jgi:2-polyprenyl-6-methoxyphenol hydroxylase-like FAD-dependent oxidoreductase
VIDQELLLASASHSESLQSWRFEFAVLEDEDPKEMSSPEQAKKIMLAYLTHPGKRYKLKHEVQFPEDCMDLRVCSPYKFAAGMCNMWHMGRALLPGDAAHVFSPFGGQGVESGFMDSSDLTWRLAVAPPLAHHEFRPTLPRLLNGTQAADWPSPRVYSSKRRPGIRA